MEKFYHQWNDKKNPELYFITADIKKCYDSINPAKLIEIIEKSPLFEEFYLINRYNTYIRNKKPILSDTKGQ